MYYYCTLSEADEIERTGRIYCEDLDDDDDDYEYPLVYNTSNTYGLSRAKELC